MIDTSKSVVCTALFFLLTSCMFSGTSRKRVPGMSFLVCLAATSAFTCMWLKAKAFYSHLKILSRTVGYAPFLLAKEPRAFIYRNKALLLSVVAVSVVLPCQREREQTLVCVKRPTLES